MDININDFNFYIINIIFFDFVFFYWFSIIPIIGIFNAFFELHIINITLIGILLIGMAFISVGLFISALTENQLVAAVSTMAIILAMILIGALKGIVDNYAVRFVLSWFSVLDRFANFGYGIFDFNALVYYLSISAVFIFLTIRVYEKRRWG